MISMLACSSAGGQTSGGKQEPYVKERIYDNKGNYQGYSIENPNTTTPGAVKERFYDKNGTYKGYSTESGGTTYYYDNKSRRIGTSTKTK